MEADRLLVVAWYDIVQNEFREMTAWVIRQCVETTPPVGGFVTRNMLNAIIYLKLPIATLHPSTWRKFSLPIAESVCTKLMRYFYCSNI